MSEYEDNTTKTDTRPCSGVKKDLIECLMTSDCVLKEKKSAKECLLTHDPSVPDECFNLRYLYFDCKRSLLDNRNRFRGRRGY